MLSKNWDIVATTAFAPIVWGSTYLVTTEYLPPDRPLLAAVLRALPAGLLLLVIARRLPQGSWWFKATVLGALNIGMFFTLLFIAAYRLPGGVAATVASVQPLLVAGLAVGLLSQRLRLRTIFLGLAGMAGVALLVLRAEAAIDPIGVGAAFASAVSMACGVVLSKRWAADVPPVALAAWQLLAGGLLMLPLMLTYEGMPPTLTTTHVAGYAYLAIIGGAVAYAVWFQGIRQLPPANVSFLGLLSPLVATGLGWVVLGQSLTLWQVVGAAVVLTAAVLAQMGTARQREPKRLRAPVAAT
ncbi:EamA family transporter [Natronoglycomyces albus]|uniref:EamA family transporter n=1 Tax=Natronoglycomyces albus TaxID=2811108 RepID=A0A895XGD4_9ACTN|nr:EamA family transporter [Natronoglycomyces albus]QSB04921.1 EamA family transporter [Natronoglycomyces albus]